MKSLTPSKLIIVAYVALFMANFPTHTYSAPGRARVLPHIEVACRATPHYDLCVRTLQSDPRSVRVDVKGLLRIFFRELTNQAGATLNKINAIVTENPRLQAAYMPCRTSFTTILTQDVSNAERGLFYEDFGQIMQGMSDVPIQADNCEKSYRISQFIKDQTKLVTDLAEIVLPIVDKFLIK